MFPSNACSREGLEKFTHLSLPSINDERALFVQHGRVYATSLVTSQYGQLILVDQYDSKSQRIWCFKLSERVKNLNGSYFALNDSGLWWSSVEAKHIHHKCGGKEEVISKIAGKTLSFFSEAVYYYGSEDVIYMLPFTLTGQVSFKLPQPKEEGHWMRFIGPVCFYVRKGEGGDFVDVYHVRSKMMSIKNLPIPTAPARFEMLESPGEQTVSLIFKMEECFKKFSFDAATGQMFVQI